MSQVLIAKPVNVQVKHRGAFVPPRYDLVKPEISISIANKLAHAYGLKSSGLMVNQNSMSTQYLSFRYFLPGEPFRYLDAAIGLDQTEVTFSNPATVNELAVELGKLWAIVFEHAQPTVTSNYFEANLHCTTEGMSTRAFLNDLVRIPVPSDEMQKGLSLTKKTRDTVVRIGLDVSESIPDGLYVAFAYVSTTPVHDMDAFLDLFTKTLDMYRWTQKIAHIDLLEPT